MHKSNQELIARGDPPTNRVEIETALDNAQLYALMANGNYWLVRRNGRTKTWKTDKKRFRIPVKAGLKAYSAIDENTNLNGFRIWG